MAEHPWGRNAAGCFVLLVIIFLIGIFIANRLGMDVSEIFRKFMDIIGR